MDIYLCFTIAMSYFFICVSGSSGILFFVAFMQKKDIANDTTKSCFFAWLGNAQKKIILWYKLIRLPVKP